MEKSHKSPGALGQCRVLDLTNETGIFCTKIFAALGADVIKIEPPGGDPTRRIGPFYHDEPGPEKSLHWFTYNLNKRSVTLNIECASGRELFKRLVMTADFLVECFRPGYLGQFELEYSRLSQINRKLVHTSITPYGSTGPHSQRKGSNLTTSAAGGYLYICGDTDRPPVQVTTPVADMQTGLNAALASLVAHHYRQLTGEGQHVDVSAQESVMCQMLPRGLLWKSHGLIAYRSKEGATIPGRPAFLGVFKCRDGMVICNTTYDRGREPLRRWMDSEGMAGDLVDKEWDPIFMERRAVTSEQKKHIDGLFAAFALKHAAGELMAKAQKMGIQVARVQDMRDVMNDQHLREKGFFVKVAHPEIGETIEYAGAPFRSDEMSWDYFRRAPFIGEHNVEVYCGELGLSRHELAVLKQGGVI